MSKDTKNISSQLLKALERLELATEILKMWVEYMDSDLSEAEYILVARSKKFLGQNKE